MRVEFDGESRGTAGPSPSPFHEGEQRIQARLGVREVMEPFAREVIRGALPQQHRDFYAQLPFLVVAARDDQERPWVTLLAGEPGFVHSPDPRELAVAAAPPLGDPLHGALRAGVDIGVLGIEPHTRRRNRVNGRVNGRVNSRVSERTEGGAEAAEGFRFQVDQGFGNCPKYITERIAHPVAPSPRASQSRRSTSLSDAAARWIAAADTFFIATGYRGRGESVAYGMDASHRGGPPGFVRVLDQRTLAFDDYAGNNHYNTLGNLGMDPRASLLFVDFDRGALLHLCGRARVIWSGEQRSIRFELDEVVERPHALPLRWTDPQTKRRTLRVAAIRDESADVRSFVFESEDGSPLPPFVAGQYLPVSLRLSGQQHEVERTYSLSNSPRDAHYRISVKREKQGLMSRHLHDELRVGDRISTGVPGGTFVPEVHSTRPAVLVSAGVGVTPLVAMLHELAGQERKLFFVHGARDGAHHTLRDEVREIVDAHANAQLHVSYSRPAVGDVEGRDYHSRGRLRADRIAELLPDLEADFYLCGPAAFLADMQSGLREAGVPDGQVHTESF